MAKLTLHVDDEVLEKAKQLAAERKMSVSALFSQLIRAMTNRREARTSIGRLAREASGIIDLKGRGHKAVLTDALKDKYGL